jgi:5-methylcytosine-specific restriction protein A
MPRKRQPREVWAKTRKKVFARDGGKCTHCQIELTIETCHIDHVQSGKHGTNELSNLRTLCRRCHVLRADFRHRGMIANALRDGVIPPDWRSHVWE